MRIKKITSAVLISNVMLIASLALAGQPLETDTHVFLQKGRVLSVAHRRIVYKYVRGAGMGRIQWRSQDSGRADC